MKNSSSILILALVLMLILGLSGLANAATIRFQASDPTDTSNPNFDIIGFGAKPSGSITEFWIQVRGNIDTHPPAGYVNAYLIEIYEKTSKEKDHVMVVAWFNDGGTFISMGWIDSQQLSSSDYKVSGNKLYFYINSDIFSNIGNDYKAMAATIHAPSDNPSLINKTYVDEAVYNSNSHSSSGGGENYDEGMIWGGLALGVVAGIIIVLIIIWFFVSYWAYKDAQRRNMDSPILWFIIVFILGIIGLIIYLIIRPKEPKQPIYEMPPPPPS